MQNRAELRFDGRDVQQGRELQGQCKPVSKEANVGIDDVQLQIEEG